MNVARATAADLDAALTMLGLLDSISRGYYPSEADDAPIYTDDDNIEHLQHIYRRLRETLDASPGWQGRVLFGAATLMDPRNQIIDPECDHLVLHPRLVNPPPQAAPCTRTGGGDV